MCMAFMYTSPMSLNIGTRGGVCLAPPVLLALYALPGPMIVGHGPNDEVLIFAASLLRPVEFQLQLRLYQTCAIVVACWSLHAVSTQLFSMSSA